MAEQFRLVSDFQPMGDQGQAIDSLQAGFAHSSTQVLLGVTGSGKTYTVAQLIQRLQRPTLVLSHNKTLAAQLYGELSGFFPGNAVEFFISYYDYYQPEAYLPASDTYIEKDASINDEIDRLRLKATSSLLARRDVIVVASVSAIYGLGNPEEYRRGLVLLRTGEELQRRDFLRQLVDVHYTRAATDLERGTFRVRGDIIELWPSYEEQALRVDTFGDTIERLSRIHPMTGEVLHDQPAAAIYPAKHFITSQEVLEQAREGIQLELEERLKVLEAQGKVVEAHRLKQRTRFDLELMAEIGYCQGIENYSRHLDGRAPGTRPYTLMDYFPKDLLVVVDESHVTLPQLRAMYRGDRMRKETLIDHGFRLPSALDNRPLLFEEWESLCPSTLYVSATPADYEMEQTGGEIVEQIIRPTGLLDPPISVHPSEGQIDHLVGEIEDRITRGQRVLVTTLTKRMAEDLAAYLGRHGIGVRYLHSDIESMRRVELIRDLRLGRYDVLVGVNLLREGLDLPEVGLVAVLDADKQGFLRSARSLFQVVGRAARNVDGAVLFYADRISDAMAEVMRETERRRRLQQAYNEEHSITPRTVSKSAEEIMATTQVLDLTRQIEAFERGTKSVAEALPSYGSGEEEVDLNALRQLMEEAAARLDFETAAELRDRLLVLEGKEAPTRTAVQGKQRESRLQAKKRGKQKASRAMKQMTRKVH